VQVGDVIETSNGLRAEISSIVTGGTALDIVAAAGWESVDTFESATAPASATAFRVTRYYAAIMETPASDTTVTIYWGRAVESVHWATPYCR